MVRALFLEEEEEDDVPDEQEGAIAGEIDKTTGLPVMVGEGDVTTEEETTQ